MRVDSNASTGGQGLTFRPDLEGLRAIAIIAVVLYHCRVPGLSGGFVGVDVFFVLSGFLITMLVIGEIDREKQLDLRKFWRRRLKRLAPAQAVVIIATICIVTASLPADEARRATITGASALAYVSNLHFLLAATDYYAAEARVDPLLHTWSLGVETQFT